MSKNINVFVWRTGLIEFSEKDDLEGALKIASGPEKLVKDLFNVVARHGYKKDELLLPGVPEALTDDEALDNMDDFLSWIGHRNTNHLITIYYDES